MERPALNHPTRLLAPLLLLLGLHMAPDRATGQTFWDPEPLPPIITTVDMDPSSGVTTIYYAPPAADQDHPKPEGFYLFKIVYSNTGQSSEQKIHTMSPIRSSYQDASAQGKSHPETYWMRSYVVSKKQELNPDGTVRYEVGDTIFSKETARAETMFLRAEYDSCNDVAEMSWNPYKGWGGGVTYQVFQGETANWTMLTGVKEDTDVTSLKVPDVPQGKQMFYYIQARKEVNGVQQYSKSNLISFETRHVVMAGRMWIDTIQGSSTSNRITFKIDPTAKVNHFSLMRQDHRDPFVGRLTRVEIGQFRDTKTRFLLDDDPTENVQGKRRFYYLAAVDGCGTEVALSNQTNSVVVKVVNNDRLNTITWDSLDVQPGNRAEYRLMRETQLNTQKPREELVVEIKDGMAIVWKDGKKEREYPATSLSFEDDVSRFEEGKEGHAYENQFCYLVRAYENTPKGNREHVSISSRKCVQLDVRLNMPTAVAPLLGGGATQGLKRNIFAPLPSLMCDWELFIYNRAGALIFKSKNEGWDGRLRSGSYAPEGAYIYRIRAIFDGKKSRTQTGSFMVVYPGKDRNANIE